VLTPRTNRSRTIHQVAGSVRRL